MGWLANAFTWWNGASWGTSIVTRRHGREVDDAVLRHRPAVVDRHQHFSPVATVRHLDHRAERKGAVRGGEALLVHDLAARGLAAVEFAAVPGSKATFGLFAGGGVGRRGDERQAREEASARHGRKLTRARID